MASLGAAAAEERELQLSRPEIPYMFACPMHLVPASDMQDFQRHFYAFFYLFLLFFPSSLLKFSLVWS